MGLQPVAGRSSYLEGTGGATYRSRAGSADPGAVGERVGYGGTQPAPGGRQSSHVWSSDVFLARDFGSGLDSWE